MVSPWTLEFDREEVPEKPKQSYDRHRMTSSCFLLCLFQAANIVTDLNILLNELINRPESELVKGIAAKYCTTDVALGILYLLVYFAAPRRVRYLPKGLIATLCMLNIVLQTELSKTLSLDDVILFCCFQVGAHAVLCLIVAEGEENFVLISLYCVGSAAYVLLRSDYGTFLTTIIRKLALVLRFIPVYVFTSIFLLIFNYRVVLNRKLLLLNQVRLAAHSRVWKKVINNQAAALAVCSTGKVLYRNVAFERLVSSSSAESIEQKFTDLLGRNSYFVSSQGEGSHLDNNLEDLCALQDGVYSFGPDSATSSSMKYSLSKTAMVFKDQAAYLICIRDFSEIENLQRKVAEGKYRNLLLSTITHDIKTPLTIMLGNLTLLGAHVKPEGLDFYQAVNVATENLQYFMKDIMDLKTISEGSFRLEYSSVYLRPVLNRLRALTGIAAKIKNLRLTISSSVEHPIRADEPRLMQVLLNLVKNSIKYTREGEVEVTAKENRTEEEGKSRIIITIRDTGIGIGEEEQKSLFKMFSMVNRRSARCETGVGIGMYLSKSIITEMGGSLDLSSEIGKGTTVTITLPQLKEELIAMQRDSASVVIPIRSEEDTDRHRSTQCLPLVLSPVSRRIEGFDCGTESCCTEELRRLGSSTGLEKPEDPGALQLTQRPLLPDEKESRKQRVLIVEDDPLVLLAIKNMVLKLGYLVETAENGEIAVNKVEASNASKESKYGLIIMDINMPVMNGYVAATLINGLIKERKIMAVPIVCVSAQDSSFLRFTHRQALKIIQSHENA